MSTGYKGGHRLKPGYVVEDISMSMNMMVGGWWIGDGGVCGWWVGVGWVGE